MRMHLAERIKQLKQRQESTRKTQQNCEKMMAHMAGKKQAGKQKAKPAGTKAEMRTKVEEMKKEMGQ